MSIQKITYALTVLSLAISNAMSADVPDFSRDVAPILQKYCVGCHSGAEPDADLRLASYAGLLDGGENGSVIKPRDVNNSQLVSRITGRVLPMMPPEDEPQPSNSDIGVLINWVASGAAGPEPAEVDRVSFAIPKILPSEEGMPVTSVAYSPNGKVLAIARFGQVELRDADGVSTLRTLAAPGKVNSLCFSRDGAKLVAATGIAGLRGEAILWDVESGDTLGTFVGHTDTLYAAELSDDGRLLATASYDRHIILWSVESGTQQHTFVGHNGAVYDLAFSPDAKILASASADATVKIWQVATGERLDTMSQPLKEQNSVDISPDGEFVVAAGEDNRIRMWRLTSTERPEINPIVFSRFAHEAAIQQVRFSHDGQLLVSAAADDTLKIWDTNTLRQRQAFGGLPRSSQAVAIAPNGDMLASGRLDGRLDLLPVQLGREVEKNTTADNNVADTSVPNRDTTDVQEVEPNGEPEQAMVVSLPVRIHGIVHNPSADSDDDLFRFTAKQGETWIAEVKAARDESPLDSHLAILDSDGQPVPRVQLQAVRDSYFTFRGKDSNSTGDFRLHNWEEMKLNQLLYADGEVVKLFHYPRGPDSGFNVYPNFGSRYSYFDTTPIAHALHAPCYIVEPHSPGSDLLPNGLPVFMLNYENDDDAQRRLGRDSRLTFVVPKDGEYLVRLRDVRGFDGEAFKYQLTVMAPNPDFIIKNVVNANPKIAPGTGRKVGVEVERIDGFDGPIDVDITNLPKGLSLAGPLQIEAGHDRAWVALLADKDAKALDEGACANVKVVGSARIRGELVQHESDRLGTIEIVEPAKVLVDLLPDHEPTLGTAELRIIELKAGETTTASIQITRNDFRGRVGFGKEDGAVNAPHGVYVDNTGLNGLLIVEGETRRTFFITAEPWVKSQERLIFVEADAPGSPTSTPVILRIIGGSPSTQEQSSHRPTGTAATPAS